MSKYGETERVVVELTEEEILANKEDANVCARCGGTNVVADAQVDVNTKEVIHWLDYAYCNDCLDETYTITRRAYQEQTNIDDDEEE